VSLVAHVQVFEKEEEEFLRRFGEVLDEKIRSDVAEGFAK
jgi:hypothetical protein